MLVSISSPIFKIHLTSSHLPLTGGKRVPGSSLSIIQGAAAACLSGLPVQVEAQKLPAIADLQQHELDNPFAPILVSHTALYGGS